MSGPPPNELEDLRQEVAQLRLALKERALLASETHERFEQMANSINEVFWMCSSDMKEMLYTSPAFETVWGISCSEVYRDPMKWVESILPEDREMVFDSFQKLLHGSYSFQFRIRRPDGSIRVIWDRCFPVYDEAGKVIRFAGVASDITAQVEAEKTISHQRAKMIAASKMSALGEMSSSIAHEINNPLAIINNWSGLLRIMIDRGELDLARVQEASEHIAKTVMRISRIVNSLKAFAREGENDSFVVTPVQNIIEDTFEFCRERYLQHGISLQLDKVPGHLSVECRSVQITQVLLNLLNNAHDAVVGLGQPWVKMSVADVGSTVELAVTDSASGIRPEIRDKLFQPFFTTKQLGQGTGLGLSISKGIVESHHGTLTLDTEAPNTRFVVSLPKTQPK